jgi:Cutinase
MGITVGPALSRALGSKWLVDGVRYTADIAGDNCIGASGGIKCVDQLVKVLSTCPDFRLYLSGYGQGAMVAGICVAFSKDEMCCSGPMHDKLKASIYAA